LRRYTQIIVDKMARHYGKNSHVIGWQTDNEMIGNDSHSDAAISDFRLWLQKKYGDLETMNREWGTVVWSGEYSDWSQVRPPCEPSHSNSSWFLRPAAAAVVASHVCIS